MIEKNDGASAFPTHNHNGQNLVLRECGMTLRAYAAISLVQPDSGIEWLDNMIRAKQRDDLAATALSAAWDARNQGFYDGDNKDMALCAYQIAAEMISLKLVATIETDRKMQSSERAIERFDSAAQDWAFRGSFDLERRLDSEREYARSRDTLVQLVRANLK